MSNSAAPRWLALMLMSMLAATLGAMPLSRRALWRAPLSDMVWQIWLPIRLPRVLHDLDLAALWADRILLLHQGRLVAHGSPQAVMTKATLTRWYRADLRVSAHHENGRPTIQRRA